jgi:hypothetical protein
MGLLDSIGVWWARLSGRELAAVEAVPVGRANDGLAAMPYGPVGANDRDYADMQSQYTDALDAWRKNPQARRIIDITTDHVLGDGLRPVASGQLGRFLDQFWRHRQNRMDMRLPAIVDELAAPATCSLPVSQPAGRHVLRSAHPQKPDHQNRSG